MHWQDIVDNIVEQCEVSLNTCETFHDVLPVEFVEELSRFRAGLSARHAEVLDSGSLEDATVFMNWITDQSSTLMKRTFEFISSFDKTVQ